MFDIDKYVLLVATCEKFAIFVPWRLSEDVKEIIEEAKEAFYNTDKFGEDDSYEDYVLGILEEKGIEYKYVGFEEV